MGLAPRLGAGLNAGVAGSAPTISVLLPACNAAATIGRAVASVQRQTREDWELVAVDDGSTDATGSILDELARGDRRIRVRHRPHEGLVAALNDGLAVARGCLVARMDADDACEPERLRKQAGHLDTHPETGLVGCLVAHGGDAVAQAGYGRHVAWLNSLVTPGQIALNRFIESPFAHPSVMFRRDLVERHGGYREGDFPEDYELWLRWAAAGVRMAKVPEVLLTWADPPERLSRRDLRYRSEAFFAVKAAYVAQTVAPIQRGRALLVWGAGRPTRKNAAHLEAHGLEIDGYIDIDPKKTGRKLGGRPVLAPTDLPGARQAFVLGYVAKLGARELIRAELARKGYDEGRDFLMCA